MPISTVGRSTPTSRCGAVADNRWSSSISVARTGLLEDRDFGGVSTATPSPLCAAGGVRSTSCAVMPGFDHDDGSDSEPLPLPLEPEGLLPAHQRADERRATREALVRVLGQCPCEDRSVAFRQHRQVRRLVHVLKGELPDVLAGKRPLPRQQFHIHDGQAVLVRMLADLVREGFGRGVNGRDAAQEPGGTGALERLHQAEVGDLDAIGDREQVARLHIQVLQVVLLDEVVESDRRVVEEAEQDVAGMPGRPAC